VDLDPYSIRFAFRRPLERVFDLEFNFGRLDRFCLNGYLVRDAFDARKTSD
jgi:hypothetical protein